MNADDHFARRDSKPTSLQGTNSEITVAPLRTDFSHSPILTERATSTYDHAVRSVCNPYTPTAQLRVASACQIKLLVRVRLVSMTATALLSVAFGVPHRMQVTSSYALGPHSELQGPTTAY